MDKLKVVKYEKKESWKLLRIFLKYGIECEVNETYEKINNIIKEIKEYREKKEDKFYRIKLLNSETIILVKEVIAMQIEDLGEY